MVPGHEQSVESRTAVTLAGRVPTSVATNLPRDASGASIVADRIGRSNKDKIETLVRNRGDVAAYRASRQRAFIRRVESDTPDMPRRHLNLRRAARPGSF
jgi:hypothetical protein